MTTPSPQKAQCAARWMALWLPRLPTDRLRRATSAPPEHAPLALYAKNANAFTLSAVDRCASAAGLHQGMSLADARAMQPDLIAYEADDDDADLKTLDSSLRGVNASRPSL